MLIRPIDTLPTRASTPARMVLAVISALFLILAAGSMLAPAQADQGGNSANAKLCQKGGYQKLYTSTGGTFASNDECTSYAAQGGKLSSAPPAQYPAAKAQCESFGGTYTEVGLQPGAFYRCTSPTNNYIDATNAGQLGQALRTCGAIPGARFFDWASSAPLYYSCYSTDPAA